MSGFILPFWLFGLCSGSLLYFYRSSASAALPDYLQDTFEHARLFDVRTKIIFMVDKRAMRECVKCQAYATRLHLDVQYIDDYVDGANYREFKKLVPYTGGSPLFGGFERFFVIEAVMRRMNLTNVLQSECDNLLYTNTAALLSRMTRVFHNLATSQAGRSFGVAAVMYIRSAEALHRMNTYALAWLRLTEKEIASLMPSDSGIPFAVKDWGSTRSEMHFLGYYAALAGPEHLAYLPALPYGSYSKYSRVLDNFIFDPASYGQLVGSNWAGDHHIVGREIIYNGLRVVWRHLTSEPGSPMVPFAADLVGKLTRLANLHIYSKDLKRWRADNDDLTRIKDTKGLPSKVNRRYGGVDYRYD